MKRLGLFIGIDNYRAAPLKCCVKDATDLASLLEKNEDGTKNFTVILETDDGKELGKSYLMQRIKRLFSRDVDVALVYFSGHGSIKESGGYLVTSDYQAHSVGLYMDEILALANKSKIKNKIIILDCCYSGKFGSPEVFDNGTAQLSSGMTILAASREDEAALEKDGNGLFTSLLLDSLKGGAADLEGYVTPGAIYAYVDKGLGLWQQRPTFKANISTFTNLRKVDPAIGTQVLRSVIDFFDTPETLYSLDPSYECTYAMAVDSHVEIMRVLQKMAKVGLIVPVGEEHMYLAAINSKSCELTAIGKQYWQLAKKDKI